MVVCTPSRRRLRSTTPSSAADKVTGKAKYSADVILPGMLHARLVRPPALGARLKSADTSAAEKLPGVRVIRDEGLIAVLHERPDMAEEALRLVKMEFDAAPAGPDDKTIFDHLVKNAPTPQVVAEKGSLAAGEELATAVVAQRYLNSYVAHAVIETYSALASVEGSKATVWASTHVPARVKQEVAQALGTGFRVRRTARHQYGRGGGQRDF
jgi:nicotinate dehydrogenase subunit B